MGDKGSALLLIDIQNDFMPGGSLAVARGEEILEVSNDLAARFDRAGRPVLASRDYHPARTVHFKEFGGNWPPHCVIGTGGALFHPDLRLPERTIVITKGMDPEKDAYSAFEGHAADGRDLESVLRSLGVTTLYLIGLATDYCVRWTGDDALRRGFSIRIVLEGVRGVDARPSDSETSLKELSAAGAQLVTHADAVAAASQQR